MVVGLTQTARGPRARLLDSARPREPNTLQCRGLGPGVLGFGVQVTIKSVMHV